MTTTDSINAKLEVFNVVVIPATYIVIGTILFVQYLQVESLFTAAMTILFGLFLLNIFSAAVRLFFGRIMSIFVFCVIICGFFYAHGFNEIPMSIPAAKYIMNSPEASKYFGGIGSLDWQYEQNKTPVAIVDDFYDKMREKYIDEIPDSAKGTDKNGNDETPNNSHFSKVWYEFLQNTVDGNLPSYYDKNGNVR